MPDAVDNSDQLRQFDEAIESGVTRTSADGTSVDFDLKHLGRLRREMRNSNPDLIAAGRNRPVSGTVILRTAMGY